VDFVAVVDQVIALLHQRGRLTYRTLQRQFQLDAAALDDLKDELIYGQRLAVDEEGRVLVWSGATETIAPAAAAPAGTPALAPLAYTPPYLAEKILTSRSALEGERKQVTVLFADLKGSMELLADRDPEEARQLLDPVLERMMDAVHRYEGMVNQVMGDGIMALFGAPLAHEDHAVRACYTALAMQAAVKQYAAEVQRTHGVPVQIRVGLHAGEVVVRAIGSDLRMDYTAVGQTTHLAARMEQMAMPGSILLTQAVLSLTEGYVQVTPLGPVPVKGVVAPVDVFELVGASGIRRRLQATAARGLTRFIGRDTEFAALVQALERAGAGHGQVVAVVGEAGVGKSRLVYEVVHAHHTQGWRVLESASVSYGKTTPYFPVLDLLRRYTHLDERDDPCTIRAKVTGQLLILDDAQQDAIAPLLALLDALPDDSPFLTLDPPQRRQRTLTALKRLLLRESQVQPLCLVFEDLHWIDAETQALLDTLVESLPTARFLLLVNYRPEYQHGWGSKTYYTQVRLDPLPPASADALLQALLGDDPSLAALTRLLIARTEGNPFFLEESVRALVETGILAGEPGAYRLTRPLPGIAVPATVQAVLAARIDRLPPDAKRLLQTAAVIGTEVPFPLLQTVAAMAPETLHRSLAQLQGAEFLYETDLFPERVHTFKHALTQNVAYQSLLTSTRQQVHRQIAQALETLFPETVETQPELLAQHYTAAVLPEPAVAYWLRAGQRALARSAHLEAIAQLTKGLEVLQTLPDTPEHARQELTLRLTLGVSLVMTKGYAAPEVEQTYTRALELCRQEGETSDLFPVLWGLWNVYATQAQLQTARELGEQLLALAQSGQDPALLLEAHRVLGDTLYHLGELPLTRIHLEQSIALYNPQQHCALAFLYGGEDPGVFSLSFAAWTLGLLGYPDQALKRSHEALTLARELSHPFSLALALGFAATLCQSRREVQAAQEQTEALIALSREQGFLLWLAAGTVLRGWALAEQGRPEEGIVQIRQGEAAYQATGAQIWRPSFLALLAEAYGKVGQTEEGLRVLTEALALVHKNEDRYYEAELYRLKGELLLIQAAGRESAEAEACFRQALDVARRQEAKALALRAAMSLSRLWQQQGKRQEAHDLLAPIYGWFTEGFDTADLQEAEALLGELA
jgi:predicted ATPase/class 3 adenylate cyclase